MSRWISLFGTGLKAALFTFEHPQDDVPVVHAGSVEVHCVVGSDGERQRKGNDLAEAPRGPLCGRLRRCGLGWPPGLNRHRQLFVFQRVDPGWCCQQRKTPRSEKSFTEKHHQDSKGHSPTIDSSKVVPVVVCACVVMVCLCVLVACMCVLVVRMCDVVAWVCVFVVGVCVLVVGACVVVMLVVMLRVFVVMRVVLCLRVSVFGGVVAGGRSCSLFFAAIQQRTNDQYEDEAEPEEQRRDNDDFQLVLANNWEGKHRREGES